MRYLIIAILIGFPLAEGTVLYHLAAGPNGYGGWVLAWLIFDAIAGVVLAARLQKRNAKRREISSSAFEGDMK